MDNMRACKTCAEKKEYTPITNKEKVNQTSKNDFSHLKMFARSSKGGISHHNFETGINKMDFNNRASLASDLQQTHGNQYMQRFLGVQSKLKISQPGDIYEQEADQVADKIMSMSQPEVQRKCPGDKNCPLENEKKGLVQLKTDQSGGREISTPDNLLSNLGSGQPLDRATRDFMEPRFGRDFRQVVVHTNSQANQSVKDINARAYSIGRNIAFGTGQYDSNSVEGRRLIAHELTHVIQQKPMITRKTETISAPSFEELLGPSLEKSRKYNPKLPPKTSITPEISPPPIEEKQPPKNCPDPKQVKRELKDNDLISKTEELMQIIINRGKTQTAKGVFHESRQMLQQADRAIRNEFGGLIPSGRQFTAQENVTVRTPQKFAEFGVPNTVTALNRIGEAAMRVDPDLSWRLCITKSEDVLLQKEVVRPLFNKHGIKFVQDYEKAHIGGQTSFPNSPLKNPHVDLPSESPFMGHTLIHEALHFYVNDNYRATASNHPLEKELMEGGAEVLARHVIHKRLNNIREFQINYGVYSSQFTYAREYLLRGGLSAFTLAYFKGLVDLLGLKPKSIQPKLFEDSPTNRFESESGMDIVISDFNSNVSNLVHKMPSGQPLDKESRSFFEPRFGHDFSHVRVHTDDKTAEFAKSINAEAFTSGNDIGFAPRRYSPKTASGKKLIAHELAHVQQQSSNLIKAKTESQGLFSNNFENNEGGSKEGPFTVKDLYEKRSEDTNIIYFDWDRPKPNTLEVDPGELWKIDGFLLSLYSLGDEKDPNKEITLYGFASEEGNVSYNWMLVQRRIKAVKNYMETNNKLKFKGKINEIPKLESSKGDIQYRKWRAVEMVGGKGESKKAPSKKEKTEGSCPEDKKDIIKTARKTAIDYMDNSIEMLRHYISGYLFRQSRDANQQEDVNDKVSKALKNHFKDESLNTAIRARGIIVEMRKWLNQDIFLENMTCGTKDEIDCCLPGGSICTKRKSSSCIFCPLYFNRDDKDISLVHESAHGSPFDISDRAYRRERVILLLNTDQALDNATNLEYFVADLNNKMSEKYGPDEEDEYSLDCKPNKEDIGHAIAWAQRWNTYANFGVAQTYNKPDYKRYMCPYVIRWFKRCDDPVLAGIYDRYNRMDKIFKDKLSIQCPSGGDKLGERVGKWDIKGKNVFICPNFFKITDKNQRIIKIYGELARALEVIEEQIESYPQLARDYKENYWRVKD